MGPSAGPFADHLRPLEGDCGANRRAAVAASSPPAFATPLRKLRTAPHGSSLALTLALESPPQTAVPFSCNHKQSFQ